MPTPTARDRRLRALLFATLSATFLPSTSSSETRFDVLPSMAITQVYDNNLFSRPSGLESDLISRFTPGLEVRGRSARGRLRARYEFDAEAYAGHSELSARQVRQEASLALSRRSPGSWTLSSHAAFSQTQRPGELNLATGLERLRGDARRLAARQVLSRPFGATTTGTAEYAFTWDAVSNGIQGRTHVATAGMQRRMSTRDTVRSAYTVRRFVFEGAGAVTAQVFTLGWDRALTRHLRLEAEGGPRLAMATVGPEISVSLRHRLPQREIGLSYAQTQATSIGEAGPVTVESLAAVLAGNVFGPLRLSAAPSVWRNRREGREAMVYRISLDAEWRLSRPVSVVASYQYSLQRGSLTGHATGDIARSIAWLRLVAAAAGREE